MQTMKNTLVVIVCLVLLSACGGQVAWQDEQLDEDEISTRLLSDHVEATLKLTPISGEATKHLIQIGFKKKDGTPIEEYDITHEKLLHFIIISEDLSYFNHVHPEYTGDGVFEIVNDFPAGGEYRMIADFKPTGGDAMTKLAWVKVEGVPAAPTPIEVSDPLEASVDGKHVSLDIGSLIAKEETNLTFHLTDEQSGQPITELEPYLGAIGHVVVLSEDGEQYVHVHAEEDQGSGPDAIFEATFPKSGVYKIWAQFQQEGKVITASYVVNVD